MKPQTQMVLLETVPRIQTWATELEMAAKEMNPPLGRKNSSTTTNGSRRYQDGNVGGQQKSLTTEEC